MAHMKRCAIFISALVCVGLMSGVGPAAGDDKVKIIDTSKCRFATRHEPAPDVAYKPGVDVDGNPVVPADINGSQVFQPPARVPIRLLIPLSELLDNPPAGLGDTNIDLGLLEVEIATGRLFLNGKPAFATHFLICDDETGN